MTSRRLLLAFVGHRALIAGQASYLRPSQIRGQLALNQRLVVHVEAVFDRMARQQAAA